MILTLGEKIEAMGMTLTRVETKVDGLVEKDRERREARMDCAAQFKELQAARSQIVGGWRLAALFGGSSTMGALVGWLIGKH